MNKSGAMLGLSYMVEPDGIEPTTFTLQIEKRHLYIKDLRA